NDPDTPRVRPAAWISATDLVQWSQRRDAQETLPELVRRLVFVTVDGPSRVAFRAGEGVQLPGADGRGSTPHGNAFVPQGDSVWEMGTSADPAGKAQADYDNRLANLGDIDPASTSFVFVTSRRWPKKDEWANDRAREGKWREVRALDADDLEAW